MPRVPMLLVVMLWIPICPTRAEDAVVVLLDDFENVGGGTKWVVVGVHGHNLGAEIADVPEGGHDGKGCARVTVGPGSALVIRREFGKGFVGNGDKECLILPGTPSKLGLWVRGNNSKTQLSANVSGARLDFDTLDFEGWKYLEQDIPALKESPARLREVRFDTLKTADVWPPDILIDDLTLVTRGGKEASLFVEFERLGLQTELSAREPFSARLRLQNLLPERRRLKVNVALTTNKTAVMSHAETLRSSPVDVELGPGEMKTWQFDYRMDPGIYNGYLTVLDPATGGLLADQRIEYAVFPGARRRKDFVCYNSGLSPIALVRNDGPRLLLFQGLEPYGLGGPARLALVEKKGVRVLPAGQELGLEGMSEAWMLFWFHGSEGWDRAGRTPYPLDVPMLVVFERKPLKAKPAGTGWEFTFAKDCGHVAFVPLYGVSLVRVSQTAKWAKSLPGEVVSRCRRLAEVSRDYPVSVEETFKVDPERDVVTVRNRFEFLSLDDDWGTRHRRVAPLEYMTAMVHRFAWRPLSVQGKVLDLDLAVGQGLWAGVEGTDEVTCTLSGLLKYINLVEQPKTIPPDEPLLAEARRNFNVHQALWHRFHNSWWAEENLACAGNVGHVFPYLDEGAQQYAKVAGRAVAAFTLNPNNLVFEFDQAKGVSYALDGQNYERMGWCDANATSNEALRAAYRYTVGTGDRSLIRQRWPFVQSFYNVPVRMSHWGDSGYNAGGGDTFGSNLNGTICFARMAYWAGDEDAYKFACYHTAKQLLALYGVTTVYPRWVVEKDLWATFQETFEPRDESGKMAFYGIDVREVAREGAAKDAPKEKVLTRIPVALQDVPFTDLRGANVGVVPWCMVQRTSDPQERFLKDHAAEYQRYMIDGLPRKWLPQWHRAVYGEQTKAPSWDELAARGEKLPSWFGSSVGPSITPNLAGWDFFFGTPPAERRAKLERFIRNNHGHIRGREFDIILAGQEQTYGPIGDGEPWRPRADGMFRKGLERVAGTAWNPVMAIATPKFQWPTLVWHGLNSPRQPPANSVGPLPLCGIVPDPERISFAVASESPNWGLSTWSAEYLNWPAVKLAGGLDRLPLCLQSLIIERGLDHTDVHVRNMLAQSEIEWNVCGPFPYFQASDFDKVFPPEEKLDLAADYGIQQIGKDYSVRWQKAKAKMYHIDFNKLYPPNCETYVHNAQVYAALWVKSTDDRDLKLALGSDDGCKVWVNGVLVWKNWVHRASGFDQDTFPIHLKKGWNSVLLKVFNRMYGCGWDFYARFVDRQLLPDGDLVFSSSPPER